MNWDDKSKKLLLSAQDFSRWQDALSCQPNDQEDLLAWIEGPLRKFFPFQYFYCAHGEIIAGEIQIVHCLASGLDEIYLQQIATSFEMKHRGALAWWLANRQPFYIDPANPGFCATNFEVEEIRQFGLINVCAHGVMNIKSNEGTYFSFMGTSQPLSGWHLDALRLIAPVLNALFLSKIASKSAALPNLAQLTPRQTSILRQLVVGLDDKTIARNLGIAEKTVRNQLSDVYMRLGVHKRSQLLTLLR